MTARIRLVMGTKASSLTMSSSGRPDLFMGAKMNNEPKTEPDADQEAVIQAFYETAVLIVLFGILFAGAGVMVWVVDKLCN